jgi:hypothetical protein
MPKRLAIPALCLFLCAVAGCGPSDYEKVAKGIQTVGLGVQGLQSVIIDGNLRGQISTEDARAIMQVCIRITEANVQASGLVRQLAKLSQEDRINLFSVIHPVLQTVDNAMAIDLIGVKDPHLKAKIKIALGTMQLTLRAIEMALVQGGNDAEN